jgi:hypothetical protein
MYPVVVDVGRGAVKSPAAVFHGRADEKRTLRETPMNRAMKHALIAAFTSPLMLCGSSSGPAAADPYRWCAVLGTTADLGTNCYFMTLEQCQATISGVGGFCTPNNFYTGAAATGDGSRRSRNRATR